MPVGQYLLGDNGELIKPPPAAPPPQVPVAQPQPQPQPAAPQPQPQPAAPQPQPQPAAPQPQLVSPQPQASGLTNQAWKMLPPEDQLAIAVTALQSGTTAGLPSDAAALAQNGAVQQLAAILPPSAGGYVPSSYGASTSGNAAGNALAAVNAITAAGGAGGPDPGGVGPAGDPVPLDPDGLPSLDDLLSNGALDAYFVLSGQAFVDSLKASCDLYDVDALAAAAVAHQEGIFGGIGDNGTSFGPWQLHAGGALPSSYASLPPYSIAAQAWAWSPAGIKYAINNMSRAGAKGKTGHPAVHAIVYTFEKPQAPASEASAANDIYDQLHDAGSGWQGIVAGWAGGPSLAPQSPGASAPAAYTPTGVVGNWRSLVDVFKLKVPQARASIKSNADGLVNLIG